MKIRIATILLTGMISLLYSCNKDSSTAITTPATPDGCVVHSGLKNGDIIPGQYIITYSEGEVNRKASVSALSDRSSEVLSRNAISPVKLRAVFAGEPGGFIAILSDEESQRLTNDPGIKVVEHDRVIALANCFIIAEPRLITWNVSRVGYGDGRGKTAWIIDTGIDMDHPDLTVDAARSKCFITGITSPDDEHGHGTHVAGIIGAINNSIGTLGVASGATLVALRVLGANGEGSVSAIIQALAYVNTNASAGDVVNMSLGEEVVSAIFNEQVQNTANRGIYISIAAGNDAQPANKFSPASANGTNIFTVSAVDSLDRFAAFSNYGNDVVDYAAPGVNILSAYPGGRYAYMSGTSMAAPHVAGLLLLKGRNLNTSSTALNDPDGMPDPIAHY